MDAPLVNVDNLKGRFGFRQKKYSNAPHSRGRFFVRLPRFSVAYLESCQHRLHEVSVVV
jgi:hypothetical protein